MSLRFVAESAGSETGCLAPSSLPLWIWSSPWSLPASVSSSESGLMWQWVEPWPLTWLSDSVGWSSGHRSVRPALRSWASRGHEGSREISSQSRFQPWPALSGDRCSSLMTKTCCTALLSFLNAADFLQTKLAGGLRQSSLAFNYEKFQNYLRENKF